MGDGTRTQRLYRIVLACGHARELWFFGDEGPLTEAGCLDDACDFYTPQAIVGKLPLTPWHSVAATGR